MRSRMVDRDTMADAFTDFVQEIEPRLRQALCAAFGGDLGRDATAQALAYGWEHWNRVQNMENPAGYLWGVGRNHARRQRHPRPVFPDVPIDASPWVEPGLPIAMAQLSEKQRVIVMLIHGLEWTYSEVASLLGVSKSTVQSQADRGMAKLRKHVGAGK
jgi:RNA polymerase sigma-70 factor (ECF subfamily)